MPESRWTPDLSNIVITCPNTEAGKSLHEDTNKGGHGNGIHQALLQHYLYFHHNVQCKCIFLKQDTKILQESTLLKCIYYTCFSSIVIIQATTLINRAKSELVKKG